jgi:glycosyltransferase involved in cell wall biosynthesis
VIKLLVIADGRSLNTIGWLKGLQGRPNIEVHLISTYPAEKIEGLASQHLVPVAFGNLGGVSRKVGNSTSEAISLIGTIKNQLFRFAATFRSQFMKLRNIIGPLTLPFYARQVKKIIDEIQPDIIHGLRIPFEGLLAFQSMDDQALVISIWGNDLTFHASASKIMGKWAEKVLQKCDGLIADASRDIRLAKDWGLNESAPTLVVPGGGGIPQKSANISPVDLSALLGEVIDQNRPIIVNPRGFRPGSVRNDTFFKAIPEVIKQFPKALFICPPMSGEPQAEEWIRVLDISSSVRLLPLIPHDVMWGLFKGADITTSISEHDGTPNSLLEAMACGSYPIAGDIESVREWVEDGKNGSLVDPGDSSMLADAIISALKNKKHRGRAAKMNAKIIEERASRNSVAMQVETFYQSILK